MKPCHAFVRKYPCDFQSKIYALKKFRMNPVISKNWDRNQHVMGKKLIIKEVENIMNTNHIIYLLIG